jgi:DNA-binding transcriptional ArsR family regulator
MSAPEEPDRDLFRILAHPVRAQVLQLLTERTASPTQIARETGESLGIVAYHVKILSEKGYAKLVREEPRRGASEHFYRATHKAPTGSEVWHQVPEALRGNADAAALRAFTTRAIAALEHGTFKSRQGSGLHWRAMFVDEEGWHELLEVLQMAQDGIQAVAQKSASRLHKKEGISVVASVAAFEGRPSGQEK